jgi:hypothetical protein
MQEEYKNELIPKKIKRNENQIKIINNDQIICKEFERKLKSITAEFKREEFGILPEKIKIIHGHPKLRRIKFGNETQKKAYNYMLLKYINLEYEELPNNEIK